LKDLSRRAGTMNSEGTWQDLAELRRDRRDLHLDRRDLRRDRRDFGY